MGHWPKSRGKSGILPLKRQGTLDILIVTIYANDLFVIGNNKLIN